MFEIIFYRLPDGKAPVEEFMDSLNIKMRNKALDSLLILEEFGNTLREPYSKQIGDGLFELRIKFASDISRIFYFSMQTIRSSSQTVLSKKHRKYRVLR